MEELELVCNALEKVNKKQEAMIRSLQKDIIHYSGEAMQLRHKLFNALLELDEIRRIIRLRLDDSSAIQEILGVVYEKSY